jgi:hypothetical protein
LLLPRWLYLYVGGRQQALTVLTKAIYLDFPGFMESSASFDGLEKSDFP